MKRVVDRDVIKRVREERDGMCLYGFFRQAPCSGGLEVHHIEKRSQLGDDVPENLVTLCSKHHRDAGEHRISPEELTEMVKKVMEFV